MSEHHDFYLPFDNELPLQCSQKSGRLLILDSSFNPPTRAHASLIETTVSQYPPGFFDAILLLLSTNNVDKSMTGASVNQRIEMMQLMASKDRTMTVGITCHGKFVDKQKAIHSRYPRLELYFILGYDTLVRLLDPKYYDLPLKQALEPFLNNCRLVCADRGQQDPMFWQRVEQEFGSSSIQRIQLDPTIERLSSTMARQNVKNECLQKVLSLEIIDFIHKNDLYK